MAVSDSSRSGAGKVTTKTPSTGVRLEALLFAVFLLCLVQFMWLSTRLLQRQHNRHDFATVPSGPVHESPVLAKRLAKLSEEEEAARRRKSRWDPGLGLREGKKPLKVQLPIFVPSLPKSGTTSMWQYFQCGGWRASHQWTRIDDDETGSGSGDATSNGGGSENRSITLIGACMHNNIQSHRPPFQGCGGDPIYTDTGYARFKVLPSGAPGTPLCYYPSISALGDVRRHYPNATVLLVVREPESWADSIMKWGNGTLLFRWGSCNFTNLPHPPSLATKSQLVDFYRWHNDNVRRAFPNLIEVTLEGDDTGQQLEDSIGVPASCWGKCSPASKFCQRLSPDNATNQQRP